MNLPIESDPPTVSPTHWNYVDVQITDGQRVLHPTHIAFDRLIFTDPPNLSAPQIEIVITNNGQSHTSQALVLPHEPGSTRIPIQLLNAEQKAPAKLIA